MRARLVPFCLVSIGIGLSTGGLACAQTGAASSKLSNAPQNQTLAAPADAAGGPWYDPRQLPQSTGEVARFSITPRGDIDGLILSDGTEVHFPPHLSTEVAFAIKPGDRVTIRGLRARTAPVVQAVTITDDRDGATIVDNGPPGPGPGMPPPAAAAASSTALPQAGPGMPPPPAGPRPPPRGPRAGQQFLETQGRVQQTLYEPHGEINGALLDNGTILHLPPAEARNDAMLLRPGQQVAANGYGTTGVLGTAIAAQAIGPSPQQLSAVPQPPPGPREHHGPPPPRP